MLISEFSKPITVKTLNESLAKRFGQTVNVDAFTTEQLEDVRNKLRTKLFQVETNESFDSVSTSDTYQKSKMFLDVVNAEIAEREMAEGEVPAGLKAYQEKNKSKKPEDKKAKSGKGSMPDGDGDGVPPWADKDDEDPNVGAKKESVVREGAEQEATLVMAAKDMVDRVTSWMEDTAEMQTESMLELGDKIKDELGIEKSEQFIAAVKPALEELFTSLESTRDALTGGVATLTGEGAPQTMGDEVDDEMDLEMEPVDAEDDAPEDDEDEFATADASAGGDEPADREKRESIDLSRRLGKMLSDSKKK